MHRRFYKYFGFGYAESGLNFSNQIILDSGV